MAEAFDAVITGLDEAGRGIGKMPSGKTFFCEGVFPGEKITCRETSSSARFSVCEAVSVITSSPSRLSPFAPGKPICGGLPLAALAYPVHLDFKASKGINIIAVKAIVSTRASMMMTVQFMTIGVFSD